MIAWIRRDQQQAMQKRSVSGCLHLHLSKASKNMYALCSHSTAVDQELPYVLLNKTSRAKKKNACRWRFTMFIKVLGNANITMFAKANSRVAFERHQRNINKMLWILPDKSCTFWVFRIFFNLKHPIDLHLIWPFVQNQWRSRSLDSQKKWRESLGCLWMRRA